MRKGLTDKQRIFGYVQGNPGTAAFEVAKALGLKRDSVSSTLLKGVREGVLSRIHGEGPRGGWVYYTTGYFQHSYRPTVWDHLLGEQAY